MYGGDGADEIRADLGGTYTVDGGTGNDTVAFKGVINQDDQIVGGGGADTFVLVGNMKVHVPVFDLLALGFETLAGDGNPVAVKGGGAANSIDFAGVAVADSLPSLTIDGAGGDDAIRGTSSGDTILGRGGNDTLRGADGDDSLNGGTGVDGLDGGGGADAFVFTRTEDSGTVAGERDMVAFSQADGDVIDLSGIDADTTQGGDQAFHFRADGNFTETPGELIALALGGRTVVFGDVDGDGLADFGIELTTAAVVDGSDFVL
jgi:Ca2+-binding RTX toxin-like protein